MLPQRPSFLNFGFSSDSRPEISQSGATCADSDATPVEHHCQVCPTCGNRLTGHRCKLVCNHCGYYLSCADYY
jgi:ribosomal protein L32